MKTISIVICFLLINVTSNCQVTISFGDSTSLDETRFRSFMDSMFKIKQIETDSLDIEREIINRNAINKMYPTFSELHENSIVSNETVKGKVVFINFWFYSCTPCMREMDELNVLYEKYRKFENFEFLSFTFEKDDLINETVKRFGINYKIFSISSAECDRLDFGNGYPTSIILDSNGIVKYIHSGGENDKDKVQEFFKKEIYPRLYMLL